MSMSMSSGSNPDAWDCACMSIACAFGDDRVDRDVREMDGTEGMDGRGGSCGVVPSAPAKLDVDEEGGDDAAALVGCVATTVAVVVVPAIELFDELSDGYAKSGGGCGGKAASGKDELASITTTWDSSK